MNMYSLKYLQKAETVLKQAEIAMQAISRRVASRRAASAAGVPREEIPREDRAAGIGAGARAAGLPESNPLQGTSTA